MLMAVASGRVALGLALIAAFSLGLAAVLVAIGVLTVKAQHLLARWSGTGPWLRRAGIAGAVAVTLAGAAIVWGAAAA